MKQYKKQGDRLIGFDKDAPTSWITLGYLVFFSSLMIMGIITKAEAAVEVPEVQIIEEIPKIVLIITTEEYNKEQERQQHLADLRTCESQNNDYIFGDSGKSVGPYQWQKATLEAKLGRPVTYDEWVSLATDYEFIHGLTYTTYYEDGEWWRWYNCSIKLGYEKN